MGYMKPIKLASGGLSGGLGWASTTGAFLSGAAKQENQTLEAQQAQAAQNDIVQQSWAANTDKAVKDYKSTQSQYNSVYQLSGGNAQITEAAMGLLSKNPGPKDYVDAVSAARQTVKADPNFTPSYMQGQYDTLNSKIQRLNPKYQRWLGDTSSLNPANRQQQSATPFGNAQGQQSSSPTPQGANTTPSFDDSNTPTPQQTPVSTPSTPQSRDIVLPSKNKPMTPYEQQMLDLRNKEFQLNKDRKPATPQEAADVAIGKEDVEKYLHDPKTGLQAKRADFGNYISQQYDFNTLQDALNRGFKASSVQDTYDQLNRFTTSLFGVDLAKMGISNTIQDTNTLRKAVANGIIQRLSTLHFGRITNAEMGMVERGFTNPTTDPNTNMKIILTLKSLINMGQEQTNAAWETVYGQGATGSYAERVKNARLAEDSVLQKYEGQRVPWAQMDSNAPDAAQNWAKLPVNTWVEQQGTGKMFYKDMNGRMKAAGDSLQ